MPVDPCRASLSAHSAGSTGPARSASSISPIRCISPPGASAAKARAITSATMARLYCGRLLAMMITSAPAGSPSRVKSPATAETRSPSSWLAMNSRATSTTGGRSSTTAVSAGWCWQAAMQ